MTIPSSISARRQLITVVMLALALAGGVVRWFAPQPSMARDLGSMLMVLWLPIVGNIIAWLIRRAKTPKHLPQGFAAGTVFEPHARIELTLLAADTPRQSRPIRAGYFDGALVVGSEAFTTRLAVPSEGEPVARAMCCRWWDELRGASQGAGRWQSHQRQALGVVVRASSAGISGCS
jgi:hypothetical protein